MICTVPSCEHEGTRWLRVGVAPRSVGHFEILFCEIHYPQDLPPNPDGPYPVRLVLHSQ